MIAEIVLLWQQYHAQENTGTGCGLHWSKKAQTISRRYRIIALHAPSVALGRQAAGLDRVAAVALLSTVILGVRVTAQAINGGDP